MIINKQRFRLYLCYFISIFILFIYLSFIFEPEYYLSLLLIFSLASIVPMVIFLKRHFDLFEPVYLFSFMYYLFSFGGLYFISTGLVGKHIDNYLNRDVIGLFNQTLLFIILNFIMFMIGYFKTIDQDIFLTIDKVEDKNIFKPLLIGIIFIFITFGLLNFLYVSYSMSGGVIEHILTVGIRRHQFQEQKISTLGYNFYYAGIYLWFYLILTTQQKSNFNNYLFLFFMFFSFLISFSGARTFATISHVLTFVAIYYYAYKLEFKNYLKIGIVSLGIIILGIFSYFYRILGGRAASYFDQQFDFNFLWTNVGFLIIDSGNIPHIPMVMKILESWAEEIGFSYGATLFYWILPLIGKTEIMKDIAIPWVMLNTYFPGKGAGGLPPTVVGEFYINFGYFGALVAMFLLGVLIAQGYNYASRKKNYWITVFFIILVMRFIFILPKAMFDVLAAPFYIFIPLFLGLSLVKFFSAGVRWRKEKIDSGNQSNEAAP